MEKQRNETRKVTEIFHDFYCDDCGTHLATSRECPDGYYETPKSFELEIYMPDGWYRLCKQLCPDCKLKRLYKVYDALDALEFKNNWGD